MSNSDIAATVLGSLGTASTIGTVAVRYLVRAIVQDELRKLTEYLDMKFESHLRIDHGFRGYTGGKRPRLGYKADEGTD